MLAIQVFYTKQTKMTFNKWIYICWTFHHVFWFNFPTAVTSISYISHTARYCDTRRADLTFCVDILSKGCDRLLRTSDIPLSAPSSLTKAEVNGQAKPKHTVGQPNWLNLITGQDSRWQHNRYSYWRHKGKGDLEEESSLILFVCPHTCFTVCKSYQAYLKGLHKLGSIVPDP